ncbi:MAG: galactokinase [Acidimicrobiia bacterium]
MSDTFIARAPGRVNLIGDHTDYTGGLVLPMTIDRWTEIRGTRHGVAHVSLTSADEADPVELDLPVDDPATVEPRWGRYVAGVAAELGTAARGFRGQVTTTIPIGAGLSSSAALELAAAYALGYAGDTRDLARLCQAAEQRASGVPCGIMDQLVIAAGVQGHALAIDCHSLDIVPVAIPDGVDVVVQFVAHRTLVGSEYADRVAECSQAEAAIGPLRTASLADVATIRDPLVQQRARHVVSENARVRGFVTALASGDLAAAGRLMTGSHRSLRDDFETSTPVMDEAVASLAATPGVYGARMTGGGFGGCVVALAAAGAVSDGWIVRAVDGASIER